MRSILYIAFFTIVLNLSAAKAEDMELTADNRVEWHQKEQKIVAIGNAVASRKDLRVRADQMSADYKKTPPAGKTQITSVHAQGNVIMSSLRADAFGHTLDYDLAKDQMHLQGSPAKIKTETETLTATDGIFYYPNAKKAIAIGNVHADNGKDQVYGDKMVAYFEPKSGSDSSLEMKRVEIYGHVKILNAETTVWADKGIYNPKSGIVKLYDNLTIEQNGNRLHGDYAQSDLNTGISKIMAGPSSNKRVTGVFKEKSKDKNKDENKAKTPAAKQTSSAPTATKKQK